MPYRPALLLAAMIIAAPAWADSVDGTVSFDQRAVKITHAYAREVVPMPEDFNPARTIKIIFADHALGNDVARSESAFRAAAEAGTVQGFQLEIVPPGNTMARFLIGHPQGGGTQMSGNLDETFELTGFSNAGGAITGRLKTKQPHEFFPLPEVDNPARTFSLDVTFTTTVIPAIKSDLSLTGPAAQASPQAQRVLAQHALLLTGNPATIRAGLDPGHPLAGRFGTDEDGREMIRQLRAFGALPPLPAFRASIKRVEVRGDRAWLLAATKSNAANYTLYRAGDGWMVGPSLPYAD